MISVILDPEIFHNADNGTECEASLINIMDNKSSLVFVTDRQQGRLRQKYQQFIETNFRNPRRRPAVTFAKYVLGQGTKLEVGPCSLESNIEAILAKCNSQPIDPYLLEVVSELVRLRVPCIILALTKLSDNGKGCYCQESIKADLEHMITRLKILCDFYHPVRLTKLCPSSNTITNERQHVSMFEEKVESWMSRKFDLRICSPEEHIFKIDMLSELFSDDELRTIFERCEKVQIDAYCYQTSGSERLVCVGECKLSFTKNYIGVEAISQLKMEMQVAERWEQKRVDKDGALLGPCKVQGFIISNGELTEEAWREARIHGIKFVKVNMPKRWRTNPCWQLTDARFQILE